MELNNNHYESDLFACLWPKQKTHITLKRWQAYQSKNLSLLILISKLYTFHFSSFSAQLLILFLYRFNTFFLFSFLLFYFFLFLIARVQWGGEAILRSIFFFTYSFLHSFYWECFHYAFIMLCFLFLISSTRRKEFFFTLCIKEGNYSHTIHFVVHAICFGRFVCNYLFLFLSFFSFSLAFASLICLFFYCSFFIPFCLKQAKLTVFKFPFSSSLCFCHCYVPSPFKQQNKLRLVSQMWISFAYNFPCYFNNINCWYCCYLNWCVFLIK